MQTNFTCINLRWHLLLLLQLCCWLIRGLLWPYEPNYTSQNGASILNFFQVGDTKTHIGRNLICVRKSISVLVKKVISDGQWCFFSVLLGTLHLVVSVLGFVCLSVFCYLKGNFLLWALSLWYKCEIIHLFSLFSAIALDKH